MTDIKPAESTPQPQPVQTVADGSKVATENVAKGAPSKPAASGYTAATEIKSLADLKEKAPEVYKAMMEGLATTIIRQNQRAQDRLEKLWREGRNS